MSNKTHNFPDFPKMDPGQAMDGYLQADPGYFNPVTPIPNYEPQPDINPAFEIYKGLILQAQKENPSSLNKPKIRQFAQIARDAIEILNEEIPAFNAWGFQA